MEKQIKYIGDCPNEGDFEKIQENLRRIMKIQKDSLEKRNNLQDKYLIYEGKE